MNHFLSINTFVRFTIGVCLIGGCQPEAGAIYRFERQLEVEGDVRTYVVNLPRSYGEQSAVDFPVVIALHGTGGSAHQMETSYGLTEKADQENYVIVYPDGVSSTGIFGIRSWNAGACCDYAMYEQVNDIGFIRQLIEKLAEDFHIDRKRVYVIGMSNGGMMAYRVACELSHKVAAIGVVSATMIMDRPCTPERSVPIVHIHSGLDNKVPLNGGIGIGGYHFPAVDSVMRVWSSLNHCDESASVTDDGAVRHTQWQCDHSALEQYVTYDGGHSWPGGRQSGVRGDVPSAAINANDVIWSFLGQFSLP
jgi:polyhydroxybutyrate depolymerase